MIGSMVLDILILIVFFVGQMNQNEFRVGNIRAFFLTSVVATMPVVIFNYLPFSLNLSRNVSVIVSVMPVLIIPVNYLILLLNRKKWLRTALVFLSFTTAIFVEQIFVIIGTSILPNGLPDYRVSSYWLDFLISAAVLGIFLLLYFGTYRLFYRLVYGDVVAISKHLYQKGYEVIEEKDNERPLIQMGREFMREFYRYNYLNICLADGTVMHFDEDNHLQLHQFNEEMMNQLIEILAQEKSIHSIGSLNERIVPLQKLEQIRDQFPLIFGQSPRYCYLLFGTHGAIGFIAAGERKENERFDLVEIQQLHYVLNQFQVVVQNLLLLDKLENTAQQIRLSGQQSIQMRENERRRIARDMHDNIIQAITAFRYQLNELYDTEKLSVSDVEADQLLHHLMTITQDIRDICFDLRPPALDATGLQSALVSLVESYHSKDELYIDLKVVGGNVLNSISEDVAICLYRVAQESLLNITKHAETNFAQIMLAADENQITMEVRDEGKGFTVPSHIHELVADGHFGLMGAQEFLDVVNGSFLVESSPGKGATIKTVIPLVKEEGANGLFYDYRR
jgi:signal transduction histidine kinase